MLYAYLVYTIHAAFGQYHRIGLSGAHRYLAHTAY